MLADAVRLAREGRAVYVMVNTHHYGKQLCAQLPVEIGEIHGIKFETPDELPNFNWKTMELEGAHPNCVVLIDHHAVETIWASILNAWVRYDEDATYE